MLGDRGTESLQGGLVWKFKASELSDCKDGKRSQNLFLDTVIDFEI